MNLLNSKLQDAVNAGTITEAFAKRIKKVARERKLKVSDVTLSANVAILRSERKFHVITMTNFVSANRCWEMENCYIVLISDQYANCISKKGYCIGQFSLEKDEYFVLDREKRLGDMVAVKNTKEATFGLFNGRTAMMVSEVVFEEPLFFSTHVMLRCKTNNLLINAQGRVVQDV